jgi:hypothetical protein
VRHSKHCLGPCNLLPSRIFSLRLERVVSYSYAFHWQPKVDNDKESEGRTVRDCLLGGCDILALTRWRCNRFQGQVPLAQEKKLPMSIAKAAGRSPEPVWALCTLSCFHSDSNPEFSFHRLICPGFGLVEDTKGSLVITYLPVLFRSHAKHVTLLC